MRRQGPVSFNSRAAIRVLLTFASLAKMKPKRTPASEPVETEAKIRVASLAAVRRLLVAAHGRLSRARALETNTLFDSVAGALSAQGKSLRVRDYGGASWLTLKGRVRVSAGLKSRPELETQVGSPEVQTQILISLGFLPRFRYQKRREVWTVGSCVVCLDDTPLGPFVEVEGSAAAIHRVSARLGLGPERFLSASYPALWFESGRTGDMVFPRSKPISAGKRE